MQSTGSVMHYPSTPVSTHHSTYNPLGRHYQPLNSSPLAPPSTPLPSAARRRLQFKGRTPSTPVSTPSRTIFHSRAVSSGGGSVFGSGSGEFTIAPLSEDPQKVFLREKFKAKCFERAARARAKAVRGMRYLSDNSSDGFDEAMDEDDEDDDDAVMDDELFRRIMANATRKDKHSYRLSYTHEVGSSFDPDMDDVEEWEHEMIARSSQSSVSGSAKQFSPCETPVDLEDEELEAYAEECTKRAALADFEDIPEEELFSWSDVEELDEARRRNVEEDTEMIH